MGIIEEFREIFVEVLDKEEFSGKEFQKTLNDFMKNKKLHQMIQPFKEYKKKQQSIIKLTFRK